MKKKEYEAPQICTMRLEPSVMISTSPPDKTIKEPFKEPEEGNADGACSKENGSSLWNYPEY